MNDDEIGILAGGDLDYALVGGRVYLSAVDLAAFFLRKGTETGFTALMGEQNPYTAGAAYAMLALGRATENLEKEIIRVEAEAILAGQGEENG